MFMRILALAAFALALVPGAALAHTGVGFEHDLAHGFLHPMGGIDHILAMLAVGVFAFVLGGRALYLVPLAFVGMMVVGFLLGLARVDLPFVELGIALSSVVIGGAAALGRPMPVVAASALVGLFAVFHGVAHGAEMPLTASGWQYGLGFVAATALLHLAGMLAALGVSRLAGRFGKPLAQGAGALFAVGGLGVLAGWL
jgi:urease accessory protein